MPFPRLHPSHLHPYRLFHLSARLRLRDRPPPPSHPPSEDDYYSLLLSHPTPNPAQKTINPARAPKSSNPTSSHATPPPSAASLPPVIQDGQGVQDSQGIQGSDKGPDNRVLFSAPLAGPSARMRGLMRGERGLGRPPEPENCCMSGCVNCVWDAYREEVEVWARARRGGGGEGKSGVGGGEDAGGEGGVGDVDGVGGMDLEGGLFEGVPVGIREFMVTEKRLRDRRAVEGAG